MIVVMGPGRCGTTLAIEILIEMGFDSYGHKEIFREIPTNTLRAKGYKWPNVVKGTGTLCKGLNRWAREGGWDIDVIILCTRKIEANIESMTAWKRGKGPVYRHLEPAQHEARIDKEVRESYKTARAQIAKSGARCVEIEFPRSATDMEYCYEKLNEALPGLGKEKFEAAWKEVVNPTKIRYGG